MLEEIDIDSTLSFGCFVSRIVTPIEEQEVGIFLIAIADVVVVVLIGTSIHSMVTGLDG